MWSGALRPRTIKLSSESRKPSVLRSGRRKRTRSVNAVKNREVRVPSLASAETVPRWCPRGGHLLAQPDSDIAAVLETALVLLPVPDSVLRLVLAIDSARLPCGHGATPSASTIHREPEPMPAWGRRRFMHQRQWAEVFCQLVLKWRPVGWAEEGGQINKSVGPFLQKRMRELGAYTARSQFTSSSDKPTRAQSIRGRMAQGMIFFPRSREWTSALVSELMTFPAGANDDQVDVLSLIGRGLPRLSGGHAPEIPADTWKAPTLDELIEMNEGRSEGRQRI